MRWHSRGMHAGTIILDSTLLLCSLPAPAVKWILLQGTEPATAPAYRPFGFIGIEYQQTDGSQIAAGPFKGQPLAPNRIGPRLENTSELQVSHVRLGLRGRLLAGKLNYWISPLAGDNPGKRRRKYRENLKKFAGHRVHVADRGGNSPLGG